MSSDATGTEGADNLLLWGMHHQDVGSLLDWIFIEIVESYMNEKDKKEFLEEFKNGDGSKRLDMWDYALEQQV